MRQSSWLVRCTDDIWISCYDHEILFLVDEMFRQKLATIPAPTMIMSIPGDYDRFPAGLQERADFRMVAGSGRLSLSCFGLRG
jgi:hypothetical protein